MIRKGIEFRRDRKLIFREGEGVGTYNAGDRKGEAIPGNYVTIFRCHGIPSWRTKKQPPKGYVLDEELTARSREKDPEDYTFWYTKQVKITGHSRTNMPYGETFMAEGISHYGVGQRLTSVKYRRVYWVEDAIVYIGRFRVNKPQQSQRIPLVVNTRETS